MKSAVSVISTLVHLVIPLGLTVIGTFRRALKLRTDIVLRSDKSIKKLQTTAMFPTCGQFEGVAT